MSKVEKRQNEAKFTETILMIRGTMEICLLDHYSKGNSGITLGWCPQHFRVFGKWQRVSFTLAHYHIFLLLLPLLLLLLLLFDFFVIHMHFILYYKTRVPTQINNVHTCNIVVWHWDPSSRLLPYDPNNIVIR